MGYNRTQLSPDKAFERHIFHRDQFAHYLRWSHVLKRAKIGMNILDFGCGSGNLLEVLYRNRFKANEYHGLDIREQTIFSTNQKYEKLDWATFQAVDLCGNFSVGNHWDMICSFEVIEHIGKENADKFLSNIAACCNDNTEVLISTPNYDEKVGAASNHIINGEVGEFEHFELQELMEKHFVVKEKYGTFASQKDYKELMDDEMKILWDELHKYYDSNLLSVMFAPMFPAQSRNCIWVLKRK
jgi:2-polyprenyl-3-methyl-5-hydroxy-6-metoxy-1,4-benzoquinol methylase